MSSATQTCSRCATPITASSSVALHDGMACLSCVTKAAKEEALELTHQRWRRTAVGVAVLALCAGIAVWWLV